MQQPKVAHLTTVDASLRYLVLPQLLAVREWGGEAVGISAPGPFVSSLEDMGIRHLVLPASTRGMSPISDVRAAWQLWRILRQEQPDVLHTHNPKPGLYGRVLGRLSNVPKVVNTIHGLYAAPDDRWWKKLIVYTLEAVASRFSHVELIQSREDFDLVTRLRITPPSHTRLLGNGVDLRRFDPSRFSDVDRMATRNQLGVGADQIVVGMVGRLVAEKGYPELFEAARRLDDRYVVLCVGPDDPDKSDTLPQPTIEDAEAGGVRFLGMRDDVDRLYHAMDVFVLPSHREGFPRAAMEAAAMGLPVIATDIRGCREVVEDGINGELISVGDHKALARAILRLGSDPELCERMGAESRRKALRDFDERRVVERVLDSYGDIFDGESSATRTPHPRRPYGARLTKRAFDLLVSALGLTTTAPLMLVVAAVVRLTQGKPVLFRQVRPGLHAETFTLVKFRTMTNVVDDDGVLLPDDLRMTRLGRLLRSTSLDELPSLLNVVKGEMSIVGPRPLLVRYLDRYSERQRRRHEMKPGLTGWAQVNGRNSMTWEEKLELDVWYVENWSLGLDLRICIRTLRALIRREGVSEEGLATASEFRGSTDADGEP